VIGIGRPVVGETLIGQNFDRLAQFLLGNQGPHLFSVEEETTNMPHSQLNMICSREVHQATTANRLGSQGLLTKDRNALLQEKPRMFDVKMGRCSDDDGVYPTQDCPVVHLDLRHIVSAGKPLGSIPVYVHQGNHARSGYLLAGR